ncbi:MAG TPA: hypothetical protein VIL01_15905 [Thermomicrobiales bacterium]
MAAIELAAHRAGRWAAWKDTAAPATDRRWLTPLLTLFILKGILLAVLIGPFTGHDEVDHFAYIERFAHGDGLGVVGETRLPAWASPYRAYVADYPNNAEVIQPPLYHVLLAPLYRAIPGDRLDKLLGLRLVSVGVGAVVVWLSYRIALMIFPDEPSLRASVPIFVALQPQFSFEAAIVNHDILLILLATLLVSTTLDGLRTEYTNRRLIWLGAIGATGLWTKVSFGLMLPVVAVAVLFAARDERWPLRRLVGALLRATGLPLLLMSPWFVRSARLYGDPTGAQRLREISDFGEQASSWWEMLSSAEFWRGRLEDFWGNFGWRLIPFDPGTYAWIYALWSVAGIGLLVLLFAEVARRRLGWPSLFSRFQWQALVLAALWVVALIGGVLYVGTIQFTQSRFAFPAMPAFALLTAVGYAAWLPARHRSLLPIALFSAMLMLDVITFLRFVIPFYYGASGATPLTR